MSGRHRKQEHPGRAGLGVAAIATSGAFAVVPMVLGAGTASAATPNANPAPAPSDTAADASTGTTTYTVKPGDTLSGISAGRGANWQAVWAANKTAVPDANMLHPGEQIRIPTSAIHAAPGATAGPASTSTVSNAAKPASLRTSSPMIGRAPAAVSAVTHAASSGPKHAAKPAASESKKITAALKPGGAVDVTPSQPSKQMKIWLTGYSYQDNTPAGSATVSHPILHKVAGGTGTYADPITVAVPGKGSGIWTAGSRFYLPSVKRYVIVEDTGASPAPSGDAGHLDMWVDGQGGTKAESDKCMDSITSESATAIYNPAKNLPVQAGPITKNGKCNIPA